MELSADEVLALAAAGEGRRVEFKRGLPRDEKTARTLAAFANTRGGMLLVGIGDRGEVLGAPHPRRTLEKLLEIAARGLEPALAVEVAIVTVGARRIVCCSVPLSALRPHAVLHGDDDAEIVVRSGSSNRAADGATLKALREQRGAKKRVDALEQRVLEWVDARSRNGAAAQTDATISGFADFANIGKQRARRAFVELERSGLIVGHGIGARRVYSRA